jgi:putative membrane protein
MKKYKSLLAAGAFLISSASLVSCNNEKSEVAAKEKVHVEEFLQKAASNDMFGMMTGMLAGDQGKEKKVSEYGQQLYHVHSRTSPAIETIAKHKNVKLPNVMDAEKKVLVDSLEVKKGKEFDKTFAEVQVTAHEEAVALYEKADKEVSDPEIQAFIDQILPVLKEHLQEAQKLKNAMAKLN